MRSWFACVLHRNLLSFRAACKTPAFGFTHSRPSVHGIQKLQFINTYLPYKMSESKSTGDKKDFQRLPPSIKPVHYEITLKPNFQTFRFEGTEDVIVNVVQKDCRQVVLNSADLDILRASFTDKSGTPQLSRSIEFDSKDEKAIFIFDNPFEVGEAHFEVAFCGELNDQMKGFYKSKYSSANKDEHYMAVTQFEASDARRAFPCWDEPALKATFNITLVVPKDYIALSNMPGIKEEEDITDPDLKIVRFAKTPIMSTYLVAVVVGKLDFVETYSKDGVLVRVYMPIGKKEQGLFALDVASKVLPYYKDYFQIAYPLPKLDLVAIPDFACGAMENWGLVTYRETCLLVDPKNTSACQKQWVALVVGHEIAHQWFGNLVTMDWWTDLWLNEGYATFVEFLCVDYLFPEYHIWTQFVAQVYCRALELDSLHSSHPIEVPVGHPSEIDEIFDDISYDKGASIIRMLHQYLGVENFRLGMHTYLKRHQYGNTCTEDLWTALQDISKKPVGPVMSTWTRQKGFPLIHVACSSEGTKRKLVLSQEKFCADGTKDKEGTQWIVPISIMASRSGVVECTSHLMEQATLEITLDEVDADSWIKLNPQAVGFFRVQYPGEELQKLLAAAKDHKLHPLDRLNLADDLFSLVPAGHANTTDALELLLAYANEDSYPVWCCLCAMLERLSLLFDYSPFRKAFHQLGCRVLLNIANRLTWDTHPDDTHQDKLLRSLVLRRLGQFGHKPTVEEAQRRFVKHCSKEQILPADLRGPIYSIVAHHGDAQTFKDLVQLYRESDLQEEEDRIGNAMGALHHHDLQKQVLDFAMSEDVRSQNSVFIVAGVSVTKEGRELAWRFFCDNRKEFAHRYPSGYLLMRMLKNICENFASLEKAAEIEQYFQENPLKGTERAVSQSVENIRLNSKWLDRDRMQLEKFFASQS